MGHKPDNDMSYLNKTVVALYECDELDKMCQYLKESITSGMKACLVPLKAQSFRHRCDRKHAEVAEVQNLSVTFSMYAFENDTCGSIMTRSRSHRVDVVHKMSGYARWFMADCKQPSKFRFKLIDSDPVTVDWHERQITVMPGGPQIDLHVTVTAQVERELVDYYGSLVTPDISKYGKDGEVPKTDVSNLRYLGGPAGGNCWEWPDSQCKCLTPLM